MSANADEPRTRVLFLCTGNSCRSQMAEGWLRHLAGDRFESLSAGTQRYGIHPRAIATMARFGVDIAGQSSDSIADYLDDPPDVVISVCTNAERNCPVFPARTHRLRWPFPDPAGATGTDDEIRAEFERVARAIADRIERWLAAGAPLAGEEAEAAGGGA